ncbi:MAG: hypothetical protein U0641_10565 [Anaerolineae bacterium]
MIANREQLHRLVDQLPESEMGTAQRGLEALTALGNDPFVQMLHDAQEDDEPLTPDEAALVEEGREQLRRGEGRSLEEIRYGER